MTKKKNNPMQNTLEEALSPNFIEVPFNNRIEDPVFIEVSFKTSGRFTLAHDDLTFSRIMNSITAAISAISKESGDFWSFFHPQLIAVPSSTEERFWTIKGRMCATPKDPEKNQKES